MTMQVSNEDLMRFLDDELPADARAQVEKALASSTELQRELARYRTIRAEMSALRADAVTGGIWGAVNRRLTRPVGWILLVVGSVVWSGWAAWVFATSETDLIGKLSIGAVVVGFLLLLFATILERWTEWQTDPYRDLER